MERLPLIRQSLYAGLFILLVLLIEGNVVQNSFLSAIGSSALASSTFLVFVRPSVPFAAARNIVGGYCVSIALGSLFYWLHLTFPIHLHAVTPFFNDACYASFAVTMVVLLMVLLKVSHPPAAGITLGLVLEHWETHFLLILVMAVFTLCMIKALLNRWLVDL